MSWIKPREWTEAELKKVRAEMGVRRTVDIAREIGISINCLYKKAREIGFRRVAKKSREFYWVDSEDSTLDLSPYNEGEFAWMNDRKYTRPRKRTQPRRRGEAQACEG